MITWAAIDRVKEGPGKDNAVARWVGGDFNCTIRLFDGGKITITGLTQGGRELVHHVRTAIAR